MTERHGREHLVFGLRVAGTYLLITLCALTLLAAAAATLFQASRFYRERIARAYARLTLALWGIRLEVLSARAFPTTQTIYISNHSSTIDLFVLLALRLPNTRFFLSGCVRRLLPLGLAGYLTRVFWTADQTFPAARARIFQDAEAVLRRSGESVYLSPEGERVTSGKIGHFNKGAFHLATHLKAPIVPLYIAVPRAIDPGRGRRARAGTVRVYVKPAITTAKWRLADLLQNKERVRGLFVLWHNEHKS